MPFTLLPIYFIFSLQQENTKKESISSNHLYSEKLQNFHACNGNSYSDLQQKPMQNGSPKSLQNGTVKESSECFSSIHVCRKFKHFFTCKIITVNFIWKGGGYKGEGRHFLFHAFLNFSNQNFFLFHKLNNNNKYIYIL